jgi:hypothetical protein
MIAMQGGVGNDCSSSHPSCRYGLAQPKFAGRRAMPCATIWMKLVIESTFNKRIRRA